MTRTAPALTSPEAEYYDRRAERQLELAARAEHPDAVAAHCALAEDYMARRERAEAP